MIERWRLYVATPASLARISPLVASRDGEGRNDVLRLLTILCRYDSLERRQSTNYEERILRIAKQPTKQLSGCFTPFSTKRCRPQSAMMSRKKIERQSTSLSLPSLLVSPPYGRKSVNLDKSTRIFLHRSPRLDRLLYQF